MKKMHLSFIITFIFSLLCFTIGNSSFIYSSGISFFTTDAGNIESTIPVCYNKNTSVYYTKVEKALSEATSGQTINVIPGTNPTITKNCEVKSGVVLNIPHNINEITYSSSLSLTAYSSYTEANKAGTATLTIYKNGNKYLVWTGTYGYNNVDVYAKCTNHMLKEKYHSVLFEASSLTQRISLYLTSQVIYDGNQTYSVPKSQTFNSSLSIEGKKTYTYTRTNLFGKTVTEKGDDCLDGTTNSNKDNYEYSYSLKYGYTLTTEIDSLSYNGNTYYIGYKPIFDWSNGNTSSVISKSNLGSFSTADTLTISDFGDTSNYSEKAIYTSSACKGSSYNNLTIASNVTLTNNGTIYVGGSLAGGTTSIGGYSGQTYGPYSTLILKTNSKIISNSNGAIYCYGYIKEDSSSNGSSLINNNGSKVYVPFVIRDYRGGGVTVSCARKDSSYKCFPFNEYEVRNIGCQAYFYYGSTLTGIGNLYAGSQQNCTTMDMIGSSSSSFIQLTNLDSSSISSYVYAKFDESSDTCDLRVYGGCTFNSMSMTVEGYEISSASFNFSVSFRYKVSLLKISSQSSATYTIPSQSFQFLPGSSLTVGEGCTLNATSSALTFYKEWPSEIKGYYSGYSKYGSTMAYIVNNGIVNVNTLTGLIKSEVSGATLTLSNNTSTTYQVNVTHSASTVEQAGIILGVSTCIDSWSTITTTTTFYNYSNDVFDTSSYNTSVASGTYTSVKDKNGVCGFHA